MFGWFSSEKLNSVSASLASGYPSLAWRVPWRTLFYMSIQSYRNVFLGFLTRFLVLLVIAGGRIDTAKTWYQGTYGCYVPKFCYWYLWWLYSAAIGTLFSYLLILFFTLLESAATNKIAVTAIGLFATVVFLSRHLIIYPAAFTIFSGSSLSSLISAHYADKIENRWIKTLFMFIIVTSSLKLLLS